MFRETKPILVNTPTEFEFIEVYPIHDMHYGSAQFNLQKWNRLHDLILEKPNRYVVWVGDLMEFSIPFNKHSDVLTQMYNVQEQKEYITALFRQFKDRTLAITDGNHEERGSKFTGMYALYDCACIAGIPDLYRTAYAVIDVGVGTGAHYMKGRQQHYVLFATHRAKQLKSFGSADALEGFDVFMYGHDHEADDHPRGKLIYDWNNHAVIFKDVECINCGAFLTYGGYGAKAGYRPKSDKLYKLVLYGGPNKKIETVGFHL